MCRIKRGTVEWRMSTCIQERVLKPKEKKPRKRKEKEKVGLSTIRVRVTRNRIWGWRLDRRLSDSLVGGSTDRTEWHLSLVEGLDLWTYLVDRPIRSRFPIYFLSTCRPRWRSGLARLVLPFSPPTVISFYTFGFYTRRHPF